MGVRIYKTEGLFPNMYKDVLSGIIYEFINEPEVIKENIGKNIDTVECLGEAFKEAFDEYAIDRTLFISGKFGTDAVITVGGTPITATIKYRMEELEKLCYYYPASKSYPDAGQAELGADVIEQVYYLEYDLPDGSVKNFIGILDKIEFDVKSTLVEYTVNFICCKEVMVM